MNGIWIRNQRKDALLFVSIFDVCMDGEIYAKASFGDIGGSCESIGKYASRERALEVLDEIQEEIWLYGAHPGNVYQMPQE